MKVLVMSQTVWSMENNSGNTLTNVFSDFPAEFAQIYCSEGIPNNPICKKYYQITDRMVLKNFFKRSSLGKYFTLGETDKASSTAFETSAKKYKSPLSLLLRELVWKLAIVDTKQLYAFIHEFHPDVIYAPCFGNLRMLRLVRKIHQKTGLPVISMISDDLYHYTEKEKSGFAHWNKHLVRESLKETFPIYAKVYTMTIEQKREYEEIFHCPLTVLRKNATIPYQTHSFHEPYKMIYAGGLYLGRFETIMEVAKAIEKMNACGTNINLDIYSQSKLKEEEKSVLQKYQHTHLKEPISYEKLIEKYQAADIALHVESFDKEQRSSTRLSFSTKIVDCLQSGAAVLAVCPEENAGFQYLKREDAACCVSDVSKIYDTLVSMIKNLPNWQEKAYRCLEKNHGSAMNTKRLVSDFKQVILAQQGVRK